MDLWLCLEVALTRALPTLLNDELLKQLVLLDQLIFLDLQLGVQLVMLILHTSHLHFQNSSFVVQ